MTHIFVSHAQNNAECAEQIRQGLEAKGYGVWREPTSLSMESILYPRTIENDLLRSAVIVLVWSNSAAQSEWVERHVLFAQRLKKRIVPVVLDDTALPSTLIVEDTLSSQAPCTDVVASLIALPDFPPSQSADPLILLYEEVAHDSLVSIQARKTAIDHAAAMLQRGEHREEVLAILEYLARTDLMMGVRDKAQEVLDADAKQASPPPPLLHPEDSRHIFGARCKNRHVTYFDKRRVCPASSMIVRSLVERAGKTLDSLYLKCGQCGEEMVVPVDCEGYK